MADERKVTINMSTELYARLQALRGKLIQMGRAEMSTTEVLIGCLEKGLPSEERRAERGLGAS